MNANCFALFFKLHWVTFKNWEISHKKSRFLASEKPELSITMGLHSHMVITSRRRVAVTRSAKRSLSCPKQHSFTSPPPLSHIAWSLVSSSFNPMFSRETGTQLVLNTYLLSNYTRHQMLLSSPYDCQILLLLLQVSLPIQSYHHGLHVLF